MDSSQLKTGHRAALRQPKISIVMPTHNRADLLARTLRALGNQTAAPDEYELILIADGHTAETANLVQASAMPYRLKYVEQAKLGAAAARNRGVELATAPLVLFLDDDMEAAPNLVRSHLDAHQHHSGAVVLGYCPTPFESASEDPFAVAARQWWDRFFSELAKPGHRFNFHDFCTGNTSMPIATFRAIGGFDGSFLGACCEDYELGYRLLQYGVRFRFVPEALSLHRGVTNFDRALRRVRSEGFGHALIVRKHPELFWSFRIHQIANLLAWIPGLEMVLWRHTDLVGFPASILAGLISTAQRARLYRAIQPLYFLLAGAAYWLGMRDALEGPGVLKTIERQGRVGKAKQRTIDVQIPPVWDAIDELLKQSRVDAVRFLCEGQVIGEIGPVIGAEPLTGMHIRDAIHSRLGLPVMYDKQNDAPSE